MDRDELNKEIEKEARNHIQGSLAGALSREAGDFLKGGSPIPLIVQAETLINTFINKHTEDSCGALKQVLQSRVKLNTTVVGDSIDAPLSALATIITKLLTNSPFFYDFVKEVDAKYGQLFQERPYFQVPGGKAHPDDEYTHESVQHSLEKLVSQINGEIM